MSGGPFLRDDLALPYCKGCGHGLVLRALDAALRDSGLAPTEVTIVTDIGCVGLADEQFAGPHTVHTTHGRSTAFATGIALADAVLGAGRTKTVVLVGDGGAMIGINHLVGSALLNPDVTVVVHDNFLFGMTGGQHSAFSPVDFVTATTRDGNAVPPLDLARVMLAARAPFVARAVAGDRGLAELLRRAIAHPGFAVVEVLELCTAYGTRWNDLSGTALRRVAEEAGYELGVLRDEPRPRFDAAYRARPRAAKPPRSRPAPARFASPLTDRTGIVIAGTAGERVQTAAAILAQAAVFSGLHATQKNDNPVTQGTGFSLSEVIVSRAPIGFTGIETPDVVLVVSDHGARELSRSGHLERSDERTVILADDGIAAGSLPPWALRLPLRQAAGGKGAALAAVRAWVERSGALEPAAIDAAVEARLGEKVSRPSA